MEDRSFRDYFEGETKQLPAFYINIIKQSLGKWWQWLPAGAVEHDHNAYLHKSTKKLVTNASTSIIFISILKYEREIIKSANLFSKINCCLFKYFAYHCKYRVYRSTW